MSTLQAARTLGRAWRRSARTWHAATAAVLALAVLLLACSGAVLHGTEDAARSRVADHYTADLRVTPSTVGAAPAGRFPDHHEAAQHLGPADAVRAQMESQGILSRRGLLEAALFERDHLPVDAPGRVAVGHAQIAIGILVGIDADDPAARSALERHLVAGELPRAAPEGPVPVLLSVERLERFLAPEERAALEPRWPPAADDLAGLRFELTAGHMRDNRTLAEGGLISRSAVVVGLFRTGLDALDHHTFIAPIADVRGLMGVDRDAPVANALLVSTRDVEAVRGAAAAEGWATEDAQAFTSRHVGQLFTALRWIAHLLLGVLFLAPTALVTHGVARQLAAHQRELDVCHAVGVPRRTIAASLALLTLHMGAVALVAAAAGLVLAGWILAAWLPGLDAAPVPLAFQVSTAALLLSGLMAAGSLAVGLAVALRHPPGSLAARLRTF